jgi:hypothetical protein
MKIVYMTVNFFNLFSGFRSSDMIAKNMDMDVRKKIKKHFLPCVCVRVCVCMYVCIYIYIYIYIYTATFKELPEVVHYAEIANLTSAYKFSWDIKNVTIKSTMFQYCHIHKFT